MKPQRPLLLPLSILVLSACGSNVVYRDSFNGTAVGQPPGTPEIGTSVASGDALVQTDPQDAGSSDRWLRLNRQVPTQPGGAYVATLTETIDMNGGVAFVGYIPAASPITMSTFFDPPPFGPSIALLHVDLLPDGDIRVNDSTVVGTYEFDTLVGFLVGFDLDASPPTATITVRGGAEDANVTVPVHPTPAGFGLGRVRILAPFEGVNAPAGGFLINDVVATKPQSE